MVNQTRISITTSLPDLGLYFIETLVKNYNVELIIIQLRNNHGLKAIIKETLSDLIPFIYKYFYYKKKVKQSIFFKNVKKIQYLNNLSNSYNIKIIYTYDINTDQNIQEVLKKAMSKYMLVLGGKIIKEPILQLSNMQWLNGHGGVLPEYRGLCSEYWAITNKDYENIGNTIHYLTKEIDKGDIISVNKLVLENKKKFLFMIEAKNHLNLINNYLNSLEKLMNGVIYKFEFVQEKARYYTCPKKYIFKRYLKVGKSEK